MEGKLVKAALSKEVFNQLEPYIEIEALSEDYRDLWGTLCNAHKLYEGDLDLDEVAELYRQTRVMTTARREVFNLVLKEIKAETIGSVELVKDLAKNLQVKEFARKIADVCLRIIDGKDGSFDEVQEFAGRAKEVQSTTALSRGWESAVHPERASTELHSLIDETSEATGLRFPIHRLREKIGDPKGGNVILILGRPEVGKTSFTTRLAAGYLAQTKEEAPKQALHSEREAIGRSGLRELFPDDRHGSSKGEASVWGQVDSLSSQCTKSPNQGETGEQRTFGIGKAQEGSAGSSRERGHEESGASVGARITTSGSFPGTKEAQQAPGREDIQEIGKGQNTISRYKEIFGEVAIQEAPSGSGGEQKGRRCKVAYLANEEPVSQVCFNILRAVVGATAEEIKANPHRYKDTWDEVRKGLYLFDATGWSIGDVDAMCFAYHPDVVVADQTDKLRPTNHRTVREFPRSDDVQAPYSSGSAHPYIPDPGRSSKGLGSRYGALAIREVGAAHATWERMAALYPATRQIAKLHDCIFINVTQASSGAAGRTTVTYDYTANNKTDKAAEADIVLGLGVGSIIDEEGEEAKIRTVAVSKSKITGWHGAVNLEFNSHTNQWN